MGHVLPTSSDNADQSTNLHIRKLQNQTKSLLGEELSPHKFG